MKIELCELLKGNTSPVDLSNIITKMRFEHSLNGYDVYKIELIVNNLKGQEKTKASGLLETIAKRETVAKLTVASNSGTALFVGIVTAVDYGVLADRKRVVFSSPGRFTIVASSPIVQCSRVNADVVVNHGKYDGNVVVNYANLDGADSSDKFSYALDSSKDGALDVFNSEDGTYLRRRNIVLHRSLFDYLKGVARRNNRFVFVDDVNSKIFFMDPKTSQDSGFSIKLVGGSGYELSKQGTLVGNLKYILFCDSIEDIYEDCSVDYSNMSKAKAPYNEQDNLVSYEGDRRALSGEFSSDAGDDDNQSQGDKKDSEAVTAVPFSRKYIYLNEAYNSTGGDTADGYKELMTDANKTKKVKQDFLEFNSLNKIKGVFQVTVPPALVLGKCVEYVKDILGKTVSLQDDGLKNLFGVSKLYICNMVYSERIDETCSPCIKFGFFAINE